MLVTDRALVPAGTLADVIAAAVAGGVDLVQVREKDLPDAVLLDLVLAITRATAGRARVVVNSRPAVARAAGTGLHLPEFMPLPEPSDMPDQDGHTGHTCHARHANQASHVWPLLGRSVHDAAGAAKGASERMNYLVAGTLFPTTSKPGVALLGIDGLRRIVAAAGTVPVLAIGGITPERVASTINAGAAGVAVRSDILSAAHPEQAARALRQALDAALAVPG